MGITQANVQIGYCSVAYVFQSGMAAVKTKTSHLKDPILTIVTLEGLTYMF